MADDKTNLPAQAPRQYTLVQAPEAVFDTANFEHMARVAGMMARSTLLPAHLRVMKTADGQQLAPGERVPNNVPVFVDTEATAANAFLIVNQARLFGGVDPFALAQVSYFVHGRLGFEGKLVQAVLERAIGAMEFVYDGEPGTKDYAITVTAWVPNSDPRRKASLRGTVAEWQTKKQDGSVLQQWQGPAGQTRMLHYRGTREWARMYAPGLALGLLDDDDLEAMRDDLRARSARVLTASGFNPLRDEEAPAGSGPARIASSAFAAARANGMPERQAAEVAGAAAVAEARAEAEEVPHDAETGEVVQEGLRRMNEALAPSVAALKDIAQADPAPAAGGAAQAEEPPISTEERDVGDQRMELKPSTKRLPRGFSQRVEIACMKLVEAKDPADLDAMWAEHAVPLIQQIADEGLPQPPVHRLESARNARQQNFATMAKVNTAAEAPKAGEALKPAATTSWLEFAEHVRDELAAAQTFEDVDDVLASTVDTRSDIPDDVREGCFEDAQARRKAIGDALAAADPTLRQAPAENAAAGSAGSDFPGDAEIPPTADQLQDTVDTWVSDMRKIKSVAELSKYNDDVITPFVKGKWGHLIPKDALDDAEHTYKTRQRLLANK